MSQPMFSDHIARQIVKIAAVVPVSAELLRQHNGTSEITDEDRARYAREAAEIEVWKVALKAGLSESGDQVVRAVGDLHKSDEYDRCSGCEDVGYESESPPWPCSTSALLGDLIGIPTPTHWSSW